MTVRVDFYLLESAHLSAESVCCRLAAKAYRQGMPVDILATSEQQARQLDEQLWSEPPGRFLPHAYDRGTDGRQLPIRILFGQEPAAAICINLGNTPVAADPPPQRILEIVPAEAEQRSASREKYKFYRARRWPLNTHKLR